MLFGKCMQHVPVLLFAPEECVGDGLIGQDKVLPTNVIVRSCSRHASLKSCKSSAMHQQLQNSQPSSLHKMELD
jgi:hypothetical protein